MLRLLALLAALPAAVLVLGALYMLGMTYLEGSPRGFWESLEWASETLSTTGYGADARWQHPVMVLFVMITQIAGIFLVFLIFPVFVLPFFEERFEARLARVLPPMEGRVLFHRYGPGVDSLVEELERVHAPFAILEGDPALARSLHERGYPVVLGRLDEDPALLAGVEQARALVTNADDHEDATFIMMARERGFTGPAYALAENPLHRAPMLKVGATAVYTPSHVLAAALAARASARISPPAEGLSLIDERVGLAEYRAHPDSPLAGRRLGEIQMRRRLGVTLVGQWSGGVFEPARGPETRIVPGAILVVIGQDRNLAKVEALAAPIPRSGPIVVAGFGTVGSKVVEMLQDAGEQTLVIAEQPGDGVDVVGNVLDQGVLERAGVREAGTLVLALSSDSAGIFATAVVRDFAPMVRLVARANRAPNVPRLYQAGADFALSVGQVTGHLLARHLLGDSGVMVEQGLQCTRMAAGRLAGRHPWQAEVRERTGAAVVAIERRGETLLDFPEDFRVEPEDAVFVCGTQASLDLYRRELDAAPR
jgi:Trk K+ transport system NAD-binding subunit